MFSFLRRLKTVEDKINELDEKNKVLEKRIEFLESENLIFKNALITMQNVVTSIANGSASLASDVVAILDFINPKDKIRENKKLLIPWTSNEDDMVN